MRVFRNEWDLQEATILKSVGAEEIEKEAIGDVPDKERQDVLDEESDEEDDFEAMGESEMSSKHAEHRLTLLKEQRQRMSGTTHGVQEEEEEEEEEEGGDEEESSSDELDVKALYDWRARRAV